MITNCYCVLEVEAQVSGAHIFIKVEKVTDEGYRGRFSDFIGAGRFLMGLENGPSITHFNLLQSP